MGNLHRNVIFKDSDRLPREPFSRFHSVNPEDLWDWMDDLRAMGVESLSIPHNSNGSNGQMFKLEDWAGDPLDDVYAEQRMRNEPVVEITQVKGTSETHPLLSTRDEFAGFEIMPYRVATNALSAVNGSYAREALLNGLAIEQAGGENPYNSVSSAQVIPTRVRLPLKRITTFLSWVCYRARPFNAARFPTQG